MLTKEKSALSKILYALLVGKKVDGKSPFEKNFGQAPNTIKSILVSRSKFVSETDQQLRSTSSDFQEDVDSAILVRERTRGSKLEGVFKKKSGRVLGESKHTLKWIPEGKQKAVILYKREVAMDRSGDGKGGSQERTYVQSGRWPEESSSEDEEIYVTGRSDESKEHDGVDRSESTGRS